MARVTTDAAGGRQRGLLFVAFLALVPSSAMAVAPSIFSVVTTAPAKIHVVEIREFEFFPATLTVKSGDTILFKNLDIAPHTATAKGWDSGKLDRNGSWRVKAGSRGTIAYICTYHPAMKGKIVVT